MITQHYGSQTGTDCKYFSGSSLSDGSFKGGQASLMAQMYGHTHTQKNTQWGLCGRGRQLELLQRKIQWSTGIPQWRMSYFTLTDTFSHTARSVQGRQSNMDDEPRIWSGKQRKGKSISLLINRQISTYVEMCICCTNNVLHFFILCQNNQLLTDINIPGSRLKDHLWKILNIKHLLMV